MLVVWTGIASSCKYDDDELWGSVDDLANRISALETLTKQMNGDIAAMQTIVTALENQETVSEVEKLTDGYILHFTNGQTATIKNGTDGKEGKDAPAIGLEKDGGVYYWTLTVDGKTEWLTDDAGNKIAVVNAVGSAGSNGAVGSAGRTPVMGVDAQGFWTMSYDGTNFKRIEDAKGNDVYAWGTDGKTLFKNVNVSDDKETITIVMNDDANTTYVLPLLRSLVYYDSEGKPADIKNLEWSGNNTIELTYTLELEGAKYTKVDESGVTINVDETNKKVTLTLQNNAVTEARGVLLFFNETTTLTSVFKFHVKPWDGKTSSQVGKIQGENGEEFYPISTPADLAWVAQQVNSGTSSFENETLKLLNDINLNDKIWTPIGKDSNNPFKGTFDGNGKTIAGLKVDLIAPLGKGLSRTAVVSGAGLFGVVNGATLKGVTIKDAKVDAAGKADAAGVLVGCVQDNVTILDVKVEKETETETPCVQGAEIVGGVVGIIHVTSSESKVEISDCTVNGIDLQAKASSTSEGESVSAGTVGGLIGSVTTASSDVTITSANLNVKGNSVSDATVVVPEGVDSDEIEFDSVVGNSGSASLPNDVKESIENNNANAEDLQINGEVIIKNSGFAQLLQKCYPDYVTLKNGNAVFSKEWAENLDALNLGTGWYPEIIVKTLEGIEKFPNITYFCCAFQGVEECDFSANIKLEQIYVHANHITSINVSKNTSLHTLVVDRNSLKSLDLSNNIALEMLELSDNPLSNVDLSRNKALMFVNAENLKLTHLDLSNNPLMKSIVLSGSTQLASLNLDNCSQLTQLKVDNTVLTSLDLEAPEKISLLSMSGVKGLAKMSLKPFTGIELLSVKNLGWSSIELSAAQKKQIITLNCSNNNIEALDLGEYPKLQTLYCDGNRMLKMNASVLSNLKQLVCGPQQTGTMTLALNDKQKELWNSTWKSRNPGVVLEGEQVETSEGTVSTYKEFIAALDNASLKEIIIKDRIDIDVTQSLDLNFGFKKITVVDGFWDKYDAAINIVKSANADPEAHLRVEISGASGRWKFNGSTTKANKYVIQSDAVQVFINNGILNLDGKLNAVNVKYASCALFSTAIQVPSTSYAIDVMTNGETETMLNLHDKAEIVGQVRFVLGNEDGIVSSVNVDGNSSIHGALKVEGNGKRLQVNKMNGTVEGEGWSLYLSGGGNGGGNKPQGGNTNGNNFWFEEL